MNERLRIDPVKAYEDGCQDARQLFMEMTASLCGTEGNGKRRGRAMSRAAAIDRFEAICRKLRAGRTLPDDAYSLGSTAGNQAAYEVFALGNRAIPGWQHPVIERIKSEDEELRGWLVGYLFALQCLATNQGEWI